ncbi:MAG TPA: 3-phosphoshikimate 1-carboxyvinyltransferase [Steroidobacteraceae bacterium]|nr:3-phosphoshikimate 1-carboxyvinyltransferase [Steroidobacteraceae bacterium]
MSAGARPTAAAAPRRWRALPAERVQGEIQVPGDKSVSHRALMLGGIAEGVTEANGFLASEDCLSTLKALQAMGVTVERLAETQVRVHGAGLSGLAVPGAALDLGNAGTAMRLMMGLLAGQSFDSTLIGDSSLMRRPMERVAQPLRAMGARIETLEGRPPVRIHGGARLTGIDYALPVASAQVKSALLLAALYARGSTRITEPVATRDHTERMLQSFGVQLTRQGMQIALAGGQRLRGCRLQVPGDFSSAAFFLVAGCLAAHGEGLILRRVGCNPTRTGLLDMLRLMGARIEVRPYGSGSGGGSAAEPSAGTEPIVDLIVHAAPLRGIRVPEELVALAIDEFPAFFIAAAAAEGETLVTGAAELRVKESDRLAVMAEGLRTLGVSCELLPDGMRIQGCGGGAARRGGGARDAGGAPPACFEGGCIDSHGDHRIAMAFAIASLRARAELVIDDVANVATSFPGFVRLACDAGLSLQDLPD